MKRLLCLEYAHYAAMLNDDGAVGFAQKSEMPRACPVELHVRRYTDSLTPNADATALGRGGFTFLAK